uniref:F-box domain-containing protein n=1 Tax=Wuchereria bancrofti TaxID=6293 RepID=A0A1I8EKZ4_WUCBA
MNGNYLPEAALLQLFEYFSPLERLKLQQCCKHFHTIYGKWLDITALDIGIVEQNDDDEQQMLFTRGIVQHAKSAKFTYRIQLTDTRGITYRLRFNSDKCANRALKVMLFRLQSLTTLTIRNGCLSEDFSNILSQLHSITTLRMWNSNCYFDKKRPNRRLLHSLFSFPLLESILILDSTVPQSSSQCTAAFPCFLADSIKGPIVNLQIVGLYISSKAIDALCERLHRTLKRLAIGCTYGKENKKDRYCKAIAKLQVMEDLDIPPYVFHLGETSQIDESITRLLSILHLNCLGFRHYNSAVLFQFIEFKMPHNIRLLRIYHSANRIPNFAQLGTPQPEPDEKPPQRKSSWLNSRSSSNMGSKNSIDSSSDRSLESLTNDVWKESSRSSVSTSGTSEITQMIVTNCSNEQKPRQTSLASRNLTIFAIEEASRKMMECARKLRRRIYSGVQVFYMQESMDTQEILGRMAAPICSPYVYTRSSKREIRVIKGDLVKPIPLSSLGMESDYEMSDWED